MNHHDLIRSDEPILNTVDLQDMLFMLQSAGRPYIHCADDGTYSVKIEMFVSAEGATFEIRSEFRHKTPKDAALQCIGRVRAALKDIKQLT